MKSTIGILKLNISLLPEEHKKVEKFASIHGQTTDEYVIESVKERLRRENEDSHLQSMTTAITPVFQELWNNEKDSSYDEI